jgi:hypothetical protein
LTGRNQTSRQKFGVDIRVEINEMIVLILLFNDFVSTAEFIASSLNKDDNE